MLINTLKVFLKLREENSCKKIKQLENMNQRKNLSYFTAQHFGSDLRPKEKQLALKHSRRSSVFV